MGSVLSPFHELHSNSIKPSFPVEKVDLSKVNIQQKQDLGQSLFYEL